MTAHKRELAKPLTEVVEGWPEAESRIERVYRDITALEQRARQLRENPAEPEDVVRANCLDLAADALRLRLTDENDELVDFASPGSSDWGRGASIEASAEGEPVRSSHDPEPKPADVAEDSRAPAPLTTRDIAEALDRIDGRSANEWAKLLADAKGNARWALPARVEAGARRGDPARWNPVELAKILIQRGRPASALDRAFRDRDALADWREDWRREQVILRAQSRYYFD